MKGSPKQFITVGHDVWDGIRKQINGVTIFVVHPETLEAFKIPIGLFPPAGKTSLELCNSSWRPMKRIKLEQSDVYFAVNDNCTPAVAAGKL